MFLCLIKGRDIEGFYVLFCCLEDFFFSSFGFMVLRYLLLLEMLRFGHRSEKTDVLNLKNKNVFIAPSFNIGVLGFDKVLEE